jgi:hypothetical protein
MENGSTIEIRDVNENRSKTRIMSLKKARLIYLNTCFCAGLQALQLKNNTNVKYQFERSLFKFNTSFIEL